MHRKTRQLRFIGTSLGALLLAGAGSAQAQTTSPDTTSTTTPVAAPTTQAPTSIDELVVTAEKRAVNIQDVPASVSAVQGDKLEVLGLKSLQDYTRYVPGLVVQTGGSPGQTTVVLRGVAPIGPGSVVGYYIDDTPLGSSGNYARSTTFALDLLPYDLDRLEVLRGPQGTLYGAGTMGGLLKYVLRQADPSKFDAKVGAEASYIDHSDGLGHAVRGAVNIPIVQDKLAIRLSGFDQQDQGYVDNVRLGLSDTNDVHQYGGRAALTFKPMDNLRINLNAMVYRLKSDDNSAVRLYDVSSFRDAHGVDIFTAVPGDDPYGHTYGFQQPFKKNINYYSGTVNWDLGPVTAVSATSWSRTATRQTQDATDLYGAYLTLFGMPAGVADFKLGLDLDKFTQEFRLVSPTGGRVEWLLGAFYTHEKSNNRQLVDVLDANYQPITGPFAGYFTPYFANISLPSTYREYAGFGDLTFNITDKWALTGGVRYAHNDQDFRQISDGLVLGGHVDQPGSSSESVWTWQADTKYHFTDRIMGYARVATGYRPGGPNVVLQNAPAVVGSDRLTSYEAGFKTTWLDGRMLFNATAFDIQWSNIQLTAFNALCGCSYLTNAGDAYSRGAEFEGFISPVEGLKLGFNGSYTKARITKLKPDALAFVLSEPLPFVPEWQLSSTIDYTWTTFNNWQATVGAGASYLGNSLTGSPIQAGTLGYSQPTRNPAHTVIDAHAGISNDRYAVNLFVRNLADRRTYSGLGPVTGLGADAYALDGFVQQPRTIGISVDASF